MSEEFKKDLDAIVCRLERQSDAYMLMACKDNEVHTHLDGRDDVEILTMLVSEWLNNPTFRQEMKRAEFFAEWYKEKKGENNERNREQS